MMSEFYLPLIFLMVCLGCVFYQCFLQRIKNDGARVMASLAMLIWSLFLPVHLYSKVKNPSLSSTAFMIVLLICVILSLVIGGLVFSPKKRNKDSTVEK